MEFQNDEDAYNTDFCTDGTPASEAIAEMRIDNCIRCGRDPEEYEGGVLMNIRLEDGVLIGDNLCQPCAEAEDPDFDLDSNFG